MELMDLKVFKDPKENLDQMDQQEIMEMTDQSE